MALLHMNSTDYSEGHLSPDRSYGKWYGYQDEGGSGYRAILDRDAWGGGNHSLRLTTERNYPLLGWGESQTLTFSTVQPYTLTVGFRLKFFVNNEGGPPTATCTVFTWSYRNSVGTIYHNGAPAIGIMANGAIGAWLGPALVAGQLCLSAPGVIANFTTDYYIEMQCAMSTLTAQGSCQIRVNGSVVATGTGVLTLYPPEGGLLNCITFYCYPGNTDGLTYLVRDIYVTDTSGSVNTGYLGDTHMGVLFPRADGFYHDFAPGGPHYPLISDDGPDYGTTIISANPIDSRDSFIYNPPLYTGGSIAGVSILICGSINCFANAQRHFKPFFRIGGVNYEGAERTLTDLNASSPFCYQWGLNTVRGQEPIPLQIFETNPATGVAWTYSDLAALEAGVRLTDAASPGPVLITQLLVELTLPGSTYSPPTGRRHDYAAIIGTGDTGVQGLSPAGLLDSGKNVKSALSGLGGVSATVKEDT